MNIPSWEKESPQLGFNKPSWETEQPTITPGGQNLAMLNRVTPESMPKTQTSLDQSRYKVFGSNVIPRYQEDAPLAAIGKDIVNYGVGTVGRIFSAPQQALMQGSRAAANAVQGKPQDFSKMNFAKDILGADENNIPANLAGMVLDPATYVGGGIVDDLARAGQFGKSATLGTTENLISRGAQQSKLNIPLSQQTATRGYLNAERNAAKRIETPDVIYGRETGAPQQLALPPAKKDVFTQVKYSTLRQPKEATSDATRAELYHGGSISPETFNISKASKEAELGQGFYAGDKSYAEEWARERNGKLYPVKVNTNNFFDEFAANTADTRYQKVKDLLVEKGLSKKIVDNNFGGPGTFSFFAEKLNKLNPGKSSMFPGSEQMAEIVKKAGFDGTIADFRDSKQYVSYAESAFKQPAMPKGTKQVGEGVKLVKTTMPPKKQQTLFSENLIDRPFVQMKGKIDNLKPPELKPNTINQPAQKAAQNGTQNATKAVDILKDDPVYKEILGDLEGAKITPDDAMQTIATQIKDKSGLTLNIKDVYRNFRDAFGKNFNYVKQKYLDPFDASKKKYVDEVKAHTDDIYNKVVKGLGIKKGSKESAAVQWYGEGVKQIDGKEVPYTEMDLLKDFGPEKAAKIKQADTIFRQQYNELIDKVNAVRQQIYPNNASKIVPKRSDYYRHFNEMAEGFEGLKNIFDTASQIDPKLAGISEFTKPKAKWASFMQKRGKGEYKADAVGGFLDYIRPAAYSIHVDPNIAKFRGLAKDIAEGTAETKNANNTIKWLNDFANNLSGKTNKYDRIIQEDIPGGRTVFRALNWLNSRVKANEVLGKFSSMVSQVANVPVAASRIKDPIAMTKGVGQTLAQIAGKGNKALSESQFINERYMSELLSRFDNKLLNKPKQFAGWLMQGADKLGTLFTWNSAYNQAVSKGIKNPVKYADDLTRSIVAGRGIGEVPLLQQAKTFQLIAPFQLEVTNMWHVMGDMAKNKDLGGIALLLLGNYLFNGATEKITGNRVTFDPIDAMIEALGEEDTNALKVGGRIAGEVLSNVPLGQSAAAMYPEYGADISTPLGSVSLPSRKELFGDTDPTRFGGGLLIAKGIQDPLYKVLPSFGGAQLKKSIEGVQSVNKGMVEKDGKMRFPVDKTAGNYIQSALFGQYSTPEAREYFDKDRRPLSEQQTNKITNKEDYETLMRRRKLQTIRDKILTARKDEKLTDEQRTKKIADLKKQIDNLE